MARQISECSKQYVVNSCSPQANRAPALETLCSEWEVCMARNPSEIGRLKVGAETLAEVINKLIEPLSLKTMVFACVVFFGSLYISTHSIINRSPAPNPTIIQIPPQVKSVGNI
ncbi:hypothetical protein HK096_002094 [Nowakowskiella sp. JEL0078]|nr:hypothetical protein HK096_002094 [Nowakowskiella sp. JEL0078]